MYKFSSTDTLVPPYCRNTREEIKSRYKPVSGPDSRTPESVGTVKGVLTEPGNQAGRNVSASAEQPRYGIENANTGKTTTIYETNILSAVSPGFFEGRGLRFGINWKLYTR
ncbi:hypothetical protein VTG60DRAFT_3151 [Thermothelomyces hinnuleus]